MVIYIYRRTVLTRIPYLVSHEHAHIYTLINPVILMVIKPILVVIPSLISWEYF